MFRSMLCMLVALAVVVCIAPFALADSSGEEIISIVLPDAKVNAYEVTLAGGEKHAFGQRDVNVRFDASVEKPMLYAGPHKVNVVVPNLEELTRIAVKRQ